MRPRDYAQVLLRKAAHDEFTIRKLLTDPASPEEVIGFHAQQGIEKMLKAVLTSRRIPYRRRHDLVELIDLIRENGIQFPEELEEVRRLNPFATEFRYDDLPPESEQVLDREWAADCVRKTRAWVEGFLALEAGGPSTGSEAQEPHGHSETQG
jgi:HEPN domain-containing protein